MLKYLVGIKGFNFNYSCHSHVNLAKLDMLHSIYGNIGSTLIINSLLLKYKISSKILMLKGNFFNKMFCDGKIKIQNVNFFLLRRERWNDGGIVHSNPQVMYSGIMKV